MNSLMEEKIRLDKEIYNKYPEKFKLVEYTVLFSTGKYRIHLKEGKVLSYEEFKNL